MAQHINVPKFGERETEGDVPYTAVSDKAKNQKNRLKMNPNNAQQNPNTVANNVSPVEVPFQKEIKAGAQNGQEAVRTKHVRSSSREDSDLRRPSDSLQHHDTVNLRVSADSIGTPKRATRQNVIEHSPLHPHHQAKVGGKGSGMPSPASWERKDRGNNLAPLTPGKSGLRSVTRGAETPDHSPAVPKFGEWDESDPTSADGFTHVFNIVREEKLNGTGNMSAAAFRKPCSKYQKQHDNEMSKKCCCFPW